MERVFAKEWEKQNTDIWGKPNGRGALDYLMAEDPNNPMGEVTDRDRIVAATVIQWLGSPVGMCFIRKCLEKDGSC